MFEAKSDSSVVFEGESCYNISKEDKLEWGTGTVQYNINVWKKRQLSKLSSGDDRTKCVETLVG